MAPNDIVLLDGILEDLASQALPSTNIDEVFEVFSFRQVLKSFDLTPVEIDDGWVDGEDDGGIDGFYTFVNGRLLSTVNPPHLQRGKSSLDIYVINCKHASTFKLAVLDKLVATLVELLDFTKKSNSLTDRYSAPLLSRRDRLIAVYKKVAHNLTELNIHVVYASRGDTSQVGEHVSARAKQLTDNIKSLFTSASASMSFIGARELIDSHRKRPRFSLELPIAKHFNQGERYVVLSKLRDYASFVSDDDSKLRRYLFDSNVRDFVGVNRVNEDILNTLQTADGPDFWYLNNGVTMLVSQAVITGDTIQLDDVQIVNGLQTTECIARHFERGGADPEDRCILIKIIKTASADVRDAVIRATNNQTAVQSQSLHATDPIQRDIEQVLLENNWYYDRRTNHYANLGIAEDRIISPLHLGAGAMSLLLRRPGAASRLKQRHLRRPELYDKIFSTSHNMSAWPRIADVLRRVEKWIMRTQKARAQTKLLSNARHLVSFISVARVLGDFLVTSQKLASFDVAALTDDILIDSWRAITRLDTHNEQVRVNFLSAFDACTAAAKAYNIKNIETLPDRDGGLGESGRAAMDPEFLKLVEARLPPGPLTKRIHKELAVVLGCSHGRVRRAIEVLVASGRHQHASRFNGDPAS